MTTPVWSFDELTDFLTVTIEKKVLTHNEDLPILVGGYEGVGKSITTIALGCEVWRKRGIKPKKDLIFYTWEEYLEANLQAMVNYAKQMPPPLIKEMVEYYKMDIDGITFTRDYDIQPGDILMYDEAGTQAYAREAMMGKNIQMAKLMISNRYLNLCHILNVPKPGSIDKYIREERTRMLIWCDAEYTKNWEQKIRNIYVYTKESYSNILSNRGWWYLFNNTGRLVRQHPPDAEVELPTDFLSYVPEDIHRHYLAKKSVFNIKQVVDILEEKKEGKQVKDKVNQVDKFVREGESKREWCERTGLSPRTYTEYLDNTPIPHTPPIPA